MKRIRICCMRIDAHVGSVRMDVYVWNGMRLRCIYDDVH